MAERDAAPSIEAPDNAFWNYWRAKLTPCPCGGALVFTGAQLRATCWVYCSGLDPWPQCPHRHGFEANHPIAYWDCAEHAAPQAVRLWNAYLAAMGWEHPEQSYSDEHPALSR